MSKIDIRVDVPEGCAVSAVYAQRGSNCMAQVRLPILGYFAPPDPNPTFEIGKRYRTRGGGVTGPLRNSYAYKEFTLGADKLDGDRFYITWTTEGRWGSYKGSTSSFDLMPGAIEDEPEAEAAPEALECERMSDLRQIHSRLNRQAERIEALRKDVDEHRAHPPKPNGGAFDCLVSKPSERIKRAIKGGWVNVYPEGGWKWDFWPTRAQADIHSGASRIACIQIPDITEGEGL